MSGVHAFLAPSSAGVWGPGGCAAHPRMAAAFPEDEQTPEARDGEAAHWVMEMQARGEDLRAGDFAGNGVTITDEMLDAVAAMVVDVRTFAATQGTKHALEISVAMPQIHGHNWGRSDFIGVDAARKIVYAWDFKFGHGYVDAFENWQTLDYTVGAVNHFQVPLDEGWTFDTRIYQPRSFHSDGPVKRWTFGLPKYLEMVAALRDAAHAAMEPDAPMTTGAHCEHCPARHACPAFLAVGGNAVDLSLRGHPLDMSPQAAGAILKTVRTARERLEDLETGLEAVVLAAIRDGKAIPGWETEQGYGRETWTVPAAEVVAMGKLMGKELAKPLETITPAQARKIGFDEAVISAYARKPKGEIKLKPVDGKAVRKAFQ